MDRRVSRRNRRIDPKKKRRRRLLLAGLLVGLAAGATLAPRLLDALAAPPPIEPPLEEVALEDGTSEPASGPRLLPARLVARTAIEGFELREGEILDDLALDAFFVLEAEVPLPDLRLRLFGEAERPVPADEVIEIGAKTRYLLQPKDALRPGASYSLVADGQESAHPTDAAGQKYLPARWAIATRGN